MKKILALLAVMAMVGGARAEVRLASLFSDNMVLQQSASATFWGWASPGENISVTGSWGAQAATTATAEGTWKLQLKTPAANNAPLTVTIKGSNTIELKNILAGEVWLCSGQSNMGMTVSGVTNAADEIAAANYPQIRLLSINLTTANEPQKECKVRGWEICASNNVGAFTATGYFFGRKLHQELKVPVGLINSSWGGTCIEAWTSWDAQQDDPAMQALKKSWDDRDKTYTVEADKKQYEADKQALAAWNKSDKKTKAPRPRWQGQPLKSQNYPANLFNAMIAPLVPFAIKGAIWYQGEGNSGRGKEYRVQMERLIVNWRTQWGYEFPFYFVQLPNFMDAWKSPVEDGGWPQIRESFAKTAKEVPNTGMAITIDVGEALDIHPKNKQAVGDRLGRVALKKTYGLQGFAWSGPVAESCKFSDGKARIKFDNGGAPLAVTGGGKIVGFALTGADGNTVAADAEIAGKDTVIVSAATVAEPVVVHYAWANNPVGVNLANTEGLPASPFRFGEMPKFEVFSKLCPDEAKQYKILYAFDPLAGKLSDGGTRFVYDTDHSAQCKGAIKKVAYFLALRDKAGATSYAFVAMDPFTTDIAKLGVPCVASGAMFQQKITGVTVKTNAKGVTAGEFAEGCNIEFYPCNYGPQNAAKISGAEDGVYDFGDAMDPKGGVGYGAMQIHNWQAKHSIICFNKFGGGHTCDLGLGSSEGKTRDWTFTSSGQNYSQAEFLVLVLP